MHVSINCASLPPGSITISFYIHPSLARLFISFGFTDSFLLWFLSPFLLSGYFCGVSAWFDTRQQESAKPELSVCSGRGGSVDDMHRTATYRETSHDLILYLCFIISCSFTLFILWILWPYFTAAALHGCSFHMWLSRIKHRLSVTANYWR